MGRLVNNIMSCFNVGDHNILLCERPNPVDGPLKEDAGVHHSFNVSPEAFELACKVFHERNVTIEHLTYRARGMFTGRELYFFDPSGNRLELRDTTWSEGMWSEGMPESSFQELAQGLALSPHVTRRRQSLRRPSRVLRDSEPSIFAERGRKG